jgi:predicted ATPase
MIKLTAIELENFQSITSKTTIPIRSLTLMFGPNGAGKSAVFDSLELLKLIFSKDWGYKSSNLISLLERWASHSSDPKSIAVGIQFEMDKNWQLSAQAANLRNLNRIHLPSLEAGDYLEDFQGQNFNFFIKFSKRIDWIIEEFKISHTAGDIIRVDFIKSNDSLTNGQSSEFRSTLVRLKIFEKDWMETSILRKSVPIVTNQENGQIFYEATFENDLGSISADKWFNDISYCQIERYLEDRPAYDSLEELISQTVQLFKILINDFMGWDREPHTSVISGSRAVPSPSELIFLISGRAIIRRNDIVRPDLVKNDKNLSILKTKINSTHPQWETLATNFSLDLRNDLSDEESEHWDELSPTKKLNSILSEELFIEHGYQISGNVRCLVGYKEIVNGDTKDALAYAKVVELFLIGQNGNKVEIEDVGSGIGYVLPVLSSLVSSGISLVQQPELHLHPALQSALGSVIVKCIENKTEYNAFSLIETHSEHILLRIFRLLKSSKQRSEHVINPLSFDNISILYFQPKGNGSTTVKRLRLSPNGELIDRWPGGFFEERYRDLFDE